MEITQMGCTNKMEKQYNLIV